MDDCLFKGKTLLVLGSNVGAYDIVHYAKINGAYTIVADYYPPEHSSAKKIADEAVMISTADSESLSKLIEDKHVDGILAGISEFNLLKAMSLSEKYALPFFCTKEQWNRVESKDQFRSLCEETGVPCPYTYFTGTKLPQSGLEKIKYPVVIKPVDASTSAGVHICMDEGELKCAEEDSLSHSSCGKIIVEEFVKGNEFTAHYTISNGMPTLSCIDNRYPVAVHEGNVTTIPAARVFPSLFIDEYMVQVNEPMLRLCRSLGIKNGVLFIQGMYDSVDGFHIFEAGLRSAGEAPYRFLERTNGINYMHVLVEHALLGKSVTFCPEKEDPYMKGKCCGIVSFVAKGGRVGRIEGLENAVKYTPSVIEYESRYPVGTETPNGDTLRQLMIRFVMICDSREQMAEDIEYLNTHITVLNDKGENMVFKMEPKRIFDY
ncbi:MAG: ATP-grasp domain-containing protein [Lachnospiraceae bacterium]|nr:ATP-grasp domain-containing protein [Lachnospiraceae bacterium]